MEAFVTIHNSALPIFCTLAWQRSGTKFLGSCFGAGLEIKSFGEIFNPETASFVNYYEWLRKQSHLENFERVSSRLFDKFFTELLAQFGTAHFDVMLNQIHGLNPMWSENFEHFLLDFVKTRGFWIILLTRSTAEIFRSSEILSLTGVAHSDADIEIKIDNDIYLDPQQYRNFHSNINSFYKLTRKSFENYPRFVEIDFKELSSNEGILPDRLMQFIESAIKMHSPENENPLIQIRSSKKGRSPLGLRSKIKNYDEIKEIEKELILSEFGDRILFEEDSKKAVD
jgi:hypothetical protein